jgi:hypothetical protein
MKLRDTPGRLHGASVPEEVTQIDVFAAAARQKKVPPQLARRSVFCAHRPTAHAESAFGLRESVGRPNFSAAAATVFRTEARKVKVPRPAPEPEHQLTTQQSVI